MESLFKLQCQTYETSCTIPQVMRKPTARSSNGKFSLPPLSFLRALWRTVSTERALGCFSHLVAILWNYRLRRGKQEAKWAQMFYHLNHQCSWKIPALKRKTTTRKNQIHCKLQTSAGWKDNFIQSCHLLPNKKSNWKHLEYTSGSSKVEFGVLFVFIRTRLVDKEDKGIRALV